MSLSGGVVSTVCAWALLRKTRVGLAVVGVCGALAHNGAQLAAAWIIAQAGVMAYLPLMILFGVATGFLTGAVLKTTLPPLEKLSAFLKDRGSGKL